MARIALPAGTTTFLVRRGLAGEVGLRVRRVTGGGSRRVALLADAHVLDLHGSRIVRLLRAARLEVLPVRLPRGEASKTLGRVARAYGELSRMRFDRGELVVALGGGAALDAAGFVAATYKRGLPLVFVPTTLLAQADACLGGKVAINLPSGKNLAGTFHPARLVLVDPDLLATLAPRDFRCGLAEMVKMAAILDGGFFSRMERGAMPSARDRRLAGWIRRSLQLKAGVVERDPLDRGPRAKLNFGHTLGHALETRSRHRLRHGEAVSIGMVFAARLSEEKGLAPPGTAERLEALLTRWGLPIQPPPSTLAPSGTPRPEELLGILRQDKKVHRGRLRLVLLRSLGRATRVTVHDPRVLLPSLRRFLAGAPRTHPVPQGSPFDPA